MANPANVAPVWTATGIRLALTAGIAASGSAGCEHELRDARVSVWPTPKKQRIRYAGNFSGKPMDDADRFALGPARPEITIEVPYTRTALAIFLCSLMQDENYAAQAYAPRFASYPSVAGMFIHAECGIGTQFVYKALGGVVDSLDIKVPEAGDDGGQPTLTAHVLFASGSRIGAYTTSAGLTVDTDTPVLSTGMYGKIGGAAATILRANVRLVNNARLSKNVGTSPDAIFLGKLVISGDMAVLVTTTDGDEADDLETAAEANTSTELEVGATSHSLISWDAKIEGARFEEVDNSIAGTFSFESCYVDSNQPLFSVSSATDILTWTT